MKLGNRKTHTVHWGAASLPILLERTGKTIDGTENEGRVEHGEIWDANKPLVSTLLE